MSGSFDSLWKAIDGRCKFTVQDKAELEHIFNLMMDCNSYLEIGTAEGNSLYVLSHAMKPGADITYVDYGEEHTRKHFQVVLGATILDGYNVRPLIGDSHDPDIIKHASSQKYDAVLIDAGHKYEDAIADARNYGHLAKKYLFFHDVQLSPVMRAFKEYQMETGLRGYTIINSEHYGYGVIKK